MNDQKKTKQQLIAALKELRQQVSELKGMKEALRKSEERLELALKGADLGLWDYDFKTGAAFINERRAEMVGYSRDELGPHINSWGKLVHPDDLDRVMNAFNAHVRGDTPLYECEHRLRHKSGEYVWILARGKVVEWDDQGYPVRIVGTSLDITDRKRAEEALQSAHDELERRVEERTAELRDTNEQLREQVAQRIQAGEALRESEERFRQVAESANEWIWEIDEKGIYRYCSAAIERILGYSPDELVGRKHFYDLFAPDVREELKETAFAAFERKEPFRNFLNPNVHKNGNIIIFETSGTPVLDEKGNLLGYRGADTDITERKRAEEQIKQAEEFLNTVVDNLPIAVFAKSAQTGQFILWNKASEALFGFAGEEVLGKTDYDFFPREQADHFWEKDRESFASGVVIDIPEEPILTKDLGTRMLHTRKVPVYDKDGRPSCLLGISQDITERKRAEQALLREKSFSDAIIDVLPGVFYLFDEQGNLLRWNSNLEQIAHGLGHQISSTRPLDFFVGDDRSRIEEAVQIGFSKGETSVEAKVTVGDGNKIPFLFTAKRVQLYDKTCLMGVGVDISDRVRVEDEKRKTQERLDLALMGADLGLWDLDVVTGEAVVNERAANMAGYSLDEIDPTLSFLLNLVHPDDGARFMDQVDATFKGRTDFLDVEYRALAKSGEWKWFLARGKVVERDEDGIPLRMVGTFMDISDRKRAEEAMQLLHSATESSISGIAIADLDGNLTYVNPAALRLWGYDYKKEVLGKPAVSFWITEKEAEEAVRLAAKTGSWIGEMGAKLKDGSPRDLQVAITLVREPNGVSVAVMASFLDISERKRAEAALRESEETFRSVFENSPQGILLSAPDGTVFKANQAACLMFGRSEQEICEVGREAVTDLNDSRLGPALEERMRTSKFIGELNLKRKDGTTFPAQISSGIFRNARGDLRSCMIIQDITEKKRAEQDLEREKRFSETALESLPSIFYLFDDQGTPIRWNKNFEKVSGYSSSEIAMMHPFDFFAEIEKSMAQEAMEKVFALGEYSFEANLLSKDGRKTCHLFHGKMVTLEQKQCLVGMAIDITDRKKAEEELRKSEALLNSIIEQSPFSMHICDNEGTLMRINPACKKWVRVTDEDVVGKYSLLKDEAIEAQGFMPMVRRVFEKGEQANFELEWDSTLVKHIGHREAFKLILSVTIFPVKDAEGRITNAVCQHVDITERKRAEERNLWLAGIVESSDDAIIGKTLDGTITSWNKGAEQTYGYEEIEVVGKPISMLVPPDRQDEVQQFLQIISRGEHIEHYETMRRRKDGREVDVSLTISPIKSAEGKIIGASTIARDMTEQKSLQRQLFRAQKMEAIGTLAGGIAHDFNNLLQVTMGFSELLLAEKDQKHPDYADLQKIFHTAQSGSELVQRLLMFSRKSEPKPEPMNLNKQIVQIEKLLRRTIPKMIDIRLDLSSDLPRINADSSQIEQVLMNLALNARDAMGGAGKLTVKTGVVTLDEEYCRLHVDADPGEYVLLEITDTGHGMDKETLEHIFEPFFTTKQMGRGTGLGLAMVYGIVKQHGGHITVYSEVGIGTTFKVYLPAIATEVKTAAEDGGVMPVFGTETILLVDDEEFVRDLGARILTKYGYTVLQAVNGKEALDLFKKEFSRISLVILDLIMPEMGGKDCLRELLKIDPEANVLVASGFSADTSVKETIQMGAKGFVTKPFRVKELLRDVRKVLDKEQ